jgi:hypothetical protein
MVGPAGVEVEAHHQRVVIGGNVNPRMGEHRPVIFKVVGDLQHRRILEQRLEPAQHQFRRKLLGGVGIKVAAGVADGDIAGLVGLGGEADPDQPRAHIVDIVRLGVDRDMALVPRLRNPGIERLLADHRFILGPVDDNLLFFQRLGGGCRP